MLYVTVIKVIDVGIVYLTHLLGVRPVPGRRQAPLYGAAHPPRQEQADAPNRYAY